MQADSGHDSDWRDGAAYAPLLEADRSLIAWEWLRRRPDYQAAADAAIEGRPSAAPVAASFGLVQFELPDRAVPAARPLWTAPAHPPVLMVGSAPVVQDADCIDLTALEPLQSLSPSDGYDHLLLSDGLRAIRLDAPAGLLGGRPIVLRYMLHGVGSVERPLMTLRRFLALVRSGGFARSLHPRECRAARWVLMLRAWDALSAGAAQREIAEVLLSSSVREPLWRSREPSIRSRVQRLSRAARAMAGGGYRSLLR